ncbi:uncharacterized protein LOC125036583 [Penaeus chinensis]|uniref:uncharacterized protein LOC125036583 n=1 Tax=Penaeus chinensis TaxID=139456 RepID=UPI001FB7D6FC|nr:uncharacterized protein LOC125036583 [Penaeus chinensis]
MMTVQRCVGVTAVLVMTMVSLAEAITINETDPSRQSGFLYLTPERRLAMPPKSVLVLTPTLSLPMGRNLPTAFASSMAISIPLTINFDDLGLTSEENRWGIIEGFDNPSPGDLAGGVREVMYKVVEESLQSVGLDGKACLLRAMCEMFELPLPNHGFIGELLDLFFSASRAAKGKNSLEHYTKAEMQGKTGQDCTPYHEACPYSFFEVPASSNSTGTGSTK